MGNQIVVSGFLFSLVKELVVDNLRIRSFYYRGRIKGTAAYLQLTFASPPAGILPLNPTEQDLLIVFRAKRCAIIYLI